MNPEQRPGAGRAAAQPQRVSITMRQSLPEGMERYARQKLQRLERHVNLHDVSLIIDHDIHSHRLSRVDVVAHLHHVRIAAHAEALALPEAIDRAIDRADRQVLQRRDRVTGRKGRVGADGLSEGAHGPAVPPS